MNNNKIYRLLRNNKELGPFTAEELISTGLKPYDLIWVDGRSAGWSYPGEMNEFKLLVATPGNELEKRISRNNAAVSSAVQTAVAINENLVQSPVKQPKPRYKISAAWSKIQTVTAPLYTDTMVAEPKKASSTKKLVVSNTNAIQHAHSLSWEQAWKDWENEKSGTFLKPPEVVKPAINKKSIKNVAQTAPVLETKFQQSLDTLTDSYINNLLTQKKRNKSFSFGKASEFILPSIALVVIFSIGYWLMHNSKTSIVAGAPKSVYAQQKVAVQPETSSNENVASGSNNQTIVSSNEVAKNYNSVATGLSSAEVKEKTKIIRAARIITQSTSTEKINNNKNSIQTNNAVTNTDVSKSTNKIATKQFDPAVINNVPADKAYNDPTAANNNDLNAAENRPVRRRTNTPGINDNAPTNQSTNTAPAKNVESKNSAKYVSVPEYVQMHDGSGDVKIQNVSNVDLDLVVIDVMYYDHSGQFKKGETLYLHNLKAGKSLTIKTPRDTSAEYATSKVSMVSSDANGISAIGDN